MLHQTTSVTQVKTLEDVIDEEVRTFAKRESLSFEPIKAQLMWILRLYLVDTNRMAFITDSIMIQTMIFIIF